MKLTEDEIRRVTLKAIEELGDKATPATVKSVVRQSIEELSHGEIRMPDGETASGRVILTAFGLNKPGIVAAITAAMSEANCDIQDLSQKLMGDFFTMIMVIDITNSPKDFKEVQTGMNEIAEKLKIKIYLQHEDVFRFMHRI